MKKIITAINNPKLNEELKKEKNFEVIGKDIQYKEAILELLEQNNKIDLIILSEEIPGEIKLEKLIEKIKMINEKIKIIFILEKENNQLEKILIKNNILDIYYNNKINLKELINIINKKEINMEEEIIKLKKIIESKNQTQKKNKKMYLEKIKKEIESKMEKRKEKQIKKEIHLKKKTKIITFSGNYKSGKSTIALIISQYFSQENYIVLLIDGDMEKSDLSMILTNHQKRRSIKSKMNYFNFSYTNKKNTKKISYKKKIYNNTYKKLINKKRSIYYYKIKNKIKINTKKINKNLFFLKNLNHVIENKVTKKRQKQRKLFLNFLEAVHKNYDFIIIELSKNNNKEINREILKKSYVNFVIMEANLLGIKEVNLILKDYFCNWNIKRENLYIISNKKNINSIHKNLISKSLCIKNRILEIKENKFYKWFIDNQIFNRKQLFLNKTTKREINQMINKIQINKKIRDKKGKEE